MYITTYLKRKISFSLLVHATHSLIAKKRKEKMLCKRRVSEKEIRLLGIKFAQVAK
jgi:hypothetical protein